MREVGAYEVKTYLPKILRRVEQGESFIITRHGRPVADLTPIKRRAPEKIHQAITDLKEFQRTHSLGRLKIRDLIQEGRKR